jgi:D-aminoacyl-tRNA deacylase
MRAVVQRVSKAKIRVEEKDIAEIGRGVVVFLGVQLGDERKDADYLSDKIIHLRIFDDDNRKLNLSLQDVNGDMLVVSQFTLLGDCRKGRRPSFTAAENPDRARMLYDYFINKTKEKVNCCTEGIFQTVMAVELINSGPVTILLDSKQQS